MEPRSEIAEEVRRSIRGEHRIHSTHGIRVGTEGADVFLEGLVDDVASKKLALERAGAAQGVREVVDRLRVRPSTRMSDAEIRDRIRGEYLDEPQLATLLLRFQVPGEPEDRPHPPYAEAAGEILVRVENGVVTLDGEVPSVAHKRLAGVLAWWVSGVSDVVNGLGVDPPEEDTDGDVVDALRLVYERDRLLDASRIRVSCAGRVVRLEGSVPTEHQRHMAEFDAWCLFGVDRVENRLRVVPP